MLYRLIGDSGIVCLRGSPVSCPQNVTLSDCSVGGPIGPFITNLQICYEYELGMCVAIQLANQYSKGLFMQKLGHHVIEGQQYNPAALQNQVSNTSYTAIDASCVCC